MRASAAIAVLLAAGYVGHATLNVPDESRAIVERAIAAHGGLDLLNKYPAARVKAKGCMTIAGTSVPFVAVHSFQAPDKVRLVQTYVTGGQLLPKVQPVIRLPSKSHSKVVLQIGE